MRLFLLLFETIFVISVLDWNQLAMEAYSGENHHQKDKQHLFFKLATLASVSSQFQSNTENTNMAIRKGSISDVELPKCTLEAHFPLILRKFGLQFMLTKLLHLNFTLVSRLRIKTSKTNRIISRVVSFQFFFF